MDDKLIYGPNGHPYEKSERKYPNGHRDVKRKLAFVSKKIGDFQHQRKVLYKNSAKVKRIIHNQVNQIVKCLRARERSLWSDVDEAYIAEDENISEELSVLQSVHARCQALFENFNDNKKAVELDKIYTILSEIKLGEKSAVKALEFMSEFETIKSMADCFGHLEGDFVKKDEFVFINKRENNSSDPVCQEFHDKKGYNEKLLPLTTVETENSKKYSNSIESEDTFEIVDLLESMSCEDTEKDYVMAEQENYETTTRNCHQEECVENVPGLKFLRISNGLENSQKTLKSNDFNPEEEWKQIYEMKHKIASFSEMSSKLSEDSKNCENQGTVSDFLNTAKCYDKNSKQNTYLAVKEAESWLCGKSCRNEKLDKSYKQNKFLLFKESDSWLHNESLDKDALNKANNFGRIYTEIRPGSSPAELIQQAFSSYFTKDSIHNWLLCD